MPGCINSLAERRKLWKAGEDTKTRMWTGDGQMQMQIKLLAGCRNRQAGSQGAHHYARPMQKYTTEWPGKKRRDLRRRKTGRPIKATLSGWGLRGKMANVKRFASVLAKICMQSQADHRHCHASSFAFVSLCVLFSQTQTLWFWFQKFSIPFFVFFHLVLG